MLIKNYKTIFPYLLKSKITPLLWGTKGVGKTEVHKQLAKELGLNLVYQTFGAVEDVGDIIGLLTEVKDEAGNVIAVKHAAPEWFPTKPGNLIFIDEFNRAPKSVLQAMLPFILEGRLHTHQLPADTHIVLAANPPTDDFIVNDVSDKALASRCCHILLEPSVEEWLDYCALNKVNDDVISFIHENNEMLAAKKAEFLIDFVEPDGRTWEKFVSPLLNLNPPENLLPEILKGLVGTVAATRFLAHRKSVAHKIRGHEVLNGYNNILRNRVLQNVERIDLINLTVEELVREIKLTDKISEKQAENIKNFLKDISIESAYAGVRSILKIGRDDINQFIGEDKELVEMFELKIEEIENL